MNQRSNPTTRLLGVAEELADCNLATAGKAATRVQVYPNRIVIKLADVIEGRFEVTDKTIDLIDLFDTEGDE